MVVTDDLVKYITAELMKRLNDTAPTKPRLRLVGRREDLSTPALARLDDSFTVEEHGGWDDPLPPEAAVLITALSIQALVRVAEGDEGCTPEGRALLSALLNGQPVAALKGGLAWRRYAATAPKGLLDRYARCEAVLESYGLKLVDDDDAAQALGGRRPLPSSAPAAPRFGEASAAGRGVLTEAEVMRLCPASQGQGQQLKLAPETIVTPLAEDYIKAMNINII